MCVSVCVSLTTARLVLKPPHVLIHSSKTGSPQRRVFVTQGFKDAALASRIQTVWPGPGPGPGLFQSSGVSPGRAGRLRSQPRV